MIDLNALLRRRVEYFERPWGLEMRLLDAQALLRSLAQPRDVSYVFCKSMPRSGHRFLTNSLLHYYGSALHYCEYYGPPDCCRTLPCTRPHNAAHANRLFMQKSHDFGFRDSKLLRGKYLIQYRSPIPRLQSNFELHARDTGNKDAASFRAFAEQETTYFINFYRKWIAAPPRDCLVVAYEDLTEDQAGTVAAAVEFIEGSARVDRKALERALAKVPVRRSAAAAVSSVSRDPRSHRFYDADLFAELERRIAETCGTTRIRFHFI